MSWNYDPSQLSTSQVFQVRLQIGDTDENGQQLQDEEIQFFLDSEANVNMASYRAAKVLEAKYTRKSDKAVGDLKIAQGKQAQQYRDLAESLLKRGAFHQIPTAGGIVVAEQQANEDNTAIRHGGAKIGMHDFRAQPTRPNTEGS